MPSSRKPVSERFNRCDDVGIDRRPVSMKIISPRNGKKVWFNTIEINYHPYCLGDNPSVSDGAPMTIEWKPQSRKVYELEQYEMENPSYRRRKVSNGMKLSVTDRAQLLLSSGYSMADIVGATLEVLKEKQAREESVKNKKWDAVNGIIENTTRKLKKVARRSSLLATVPVRMSRRGSLPPTGPEDGTHVLKSSNTKSRRNSLFGNVPLDTISDPVIDGARTA